MLRILCIPFYGKIGGRKNENEVHVSRGLLVYSRFDLIRTVEYAGLSGCSIFRVSDYELYAALYSHVIAILGEAALTRPLYVYSCLIFSNGSHRVWRDTDLSEWMSSDLVMIEVVSLPFRESYQLVQLQPITIEIICFSISVWFLYLFLSELIIPYIWDNLYIEDNYSSYRIIDFISYNSFHFEW